MNYRKLFYGFFVIALFVAIFMLVGCNGGDCGYNCDGGRACGMACNGYGGCVGMPVMDGCTPVGVDACDTFGSCVGCGIENGDLEMYADKSQYLVGDSAYVYIYVSGNAANGNFAKASFISILEDTTGKAKIQREDDCIILTTTEVGSVTLEAKLGDYSATCTVQFVTAESIAQNFYIELDELQSTMFVGAEYYMSVLSGNNAVNIDQNSVVYTLSDNTANATIKGNKLTATEEGRVTVTAKYTFAGNDFYDSKTYTFSKPNVILYTEGELCVGSRVALSYEISSSEYMPNSSMYMKYSIISGNAEIIEDNGNFYIIANEEGDVTVSMKYEYDTYCLLAEKTLHFSYQGFTISSGDAALYVGSDIALSATSAIPGFDANTVKYKVVSGNATIEGNTLKAYSSGEVRISATAECNGVEMTSNELVLKFNYSGNVIASADDLQKLNNSKETHYLIADIDLSNVTSWTPIENFGGTLVGNGHTISGLNITVNNLDKSKGLFGVLTGTVQDLNLKGSITCRGEASYIGLLCGENKGTLTNVSVSGKISAPYCDYVGGIAGNSTTSRITGCTSNVEIEARNYVGGIAGHIIAVRSASVIFENNKNKGAITGESYVGGIAGRFIPEDGKNNDIITVNHVKNEADINGSKQYVGGLFGDLEGKYSYLSYDPYYSYIKLTDSHNIGVITGNDYVGGLIGYSSAYVSEVIFCTNTGDVTGNLYVGGFAGCATGTTLSGLKNSVTVTGKAYVGGIAGYAGTVDKCENNGKIIAVQYYLDTNNNPLSYVGGIAGYTEGAANCTNNVDIDVSKGGYYVGGIAGYINAYRSASKIIDTNVNHGKIKGTNCVGGIAGMFNVQGGKNNDTIIINGNKNNGIIDATGNYVGGLFGWLKGTYSYLSYDPYYSRVKITDSHNTAAVSGNDYVGGVVGYAPEYFSEMILCTSFDDVTGNMYVGGFVGYANGTHLKGLENSNTITGKAYVGGIAGYAGKVEDCTNSGEIIVVRYYLDSNNTPLSYVGGIAGFATGAVNCTNNSVIDASRCGYYVGGIIGYLHATRSADATISGNVNHGSVSGTYYVGGIAGYMTPVDGKSNATIIVSVNKNDGSISGTGNYVGGIFGYVAGDNSYLSYDNYYSYVKIIDCTNDASVSGANYVGGIAGYCGDYMIKDTIVWNTNANFGNISANKGTKKGQLYGAMK